MNNAVVATGTSQKKGPTAKVFANGSIHPDTLYSIRNKHDGSIMSVNDTKEDVIRRSFIFDSAPENMEIAEYRLATIKQYKVGVIEEK